MQPLTNPSLALGWGFFTGSDMTPRGRVYLACPAYPLEPAGLARARTAAARWAEALDLTLVESPLLERSAPPGAWLPAADRRRDLAHGLGHDWYLAGRGGYGCVDLLPCPPGPARIVGYSDLTILHAVRPGGLYGFLSGVPHGPRAFDSAVALARGEGQRIPATVLHPGTAAGPLFAACLRVLTGLVGTPWMPALAGHLLVLEDIDERPYRLDRDLWQLAHSGALAGVRGLIGGTFPCALPTGYGGPTADEVLSAWGQRLGIPVLGQVPCGHDPDPWTLAQGRHSRILPDLLIQDPL